MLFVVWRDSMRETGWRSAEDARKDLEKPDHLDCETTGFLVGESDERLMLALNHQKVAGGVEMVGETIIIPKEAIVSRKELRVR